MRNALVQKLWIENDMLHEYGRPYAEGTAAVDMDPLSLLCRVAAIVPPPRHHTVGKDVALDRGKARIDGSACQHVGRSGRAGAIIGGGTSVTKRSWG